MNDTATTTESKPKWPTIAYWISTGLFCLAMLNGAFMDLTKADFIMESMERLGYPEYLPTILGVCKLLGAVVLLAPMFKRLKEWAYAGFTFNLLGAAASHALAVDPPTTLIAPVVLWLILMASYFFYSRR
jgi:uncharacterized membrane protein YphA (DoxX/SURF4 family)